MKPAVGTRDNVMLIGRWAVGIIALAWGVSTAVAQDVRVRYRPLSAQEIADYGLPSDLQKSGGAANVGIGQPVYMEVLADNEAVVQSVSWTLLNTPPGSTATIQPSPLDAAMPPIPAYDPGDQEDMFVADRALLKPDVATFFDLSLPPGEREFVDYDVETVVVTDLDTLTFTNSVYAGPYIGLEPDNQLCTICHADQWANYNETRHAFAFTEAITDDTGHFQAFCIACHTTGYDAHPDAVNDGFDDVAAEIGWTFPPTLTETNWTEMDPALQNKANVLCEACHGIADNHARSLGRTEAIDVSLSAGTCAQCHDRLTHHIKTVEWKESGHGTGHYAHEYIGRSPCQSCHNGAGFVMANDPVYETKSFRDTVTGEEGISCAVCHDPHESGDWAHQLRQFDSAPLGDTEELITVGGSGLLCMNCHHSRRDGRSYVEDYSGGTFRGPHHGPQSDMLVGKNAYEFGLDLPSSAAHLHAIEDSCVTCHMQETAEASPEHLMAGGHTWVMAYDNGTPDMDEDDIHLVEACQQCHGEVEDFNFGGEDWDRDGMVEGTQHEIEDLIHMVEALLPAGSPGTSWSTDQLGAYYNLHFVEEDGSHGVHNPKYAAALLQMSVGVLTGGIDIDGDGLLDEWEWENFGSLTAQSGDDDYDMDGLTNKMEQEIGTNPMMADSDMDGFYDLAELQGGSNPTNMASVLSSNTVFQMLPAMELGYVPQTMGVTQQWQEVDLLDNTAGWVDVGPPFLSSNSMAYQLMSLRGSTQKYFRVIEP